MIHSVKAHIVERTDVCPGHLRLRLQADDIARDAAAGQFVNVRCGERKFAQRAFDGWQALRCEHRGGSAAGEPGLLMRPFAIHRAWTQGERAGQIEVLFKVVGRGTRALAALEVGATLDVLGPLGRGFDLDWCSKLSTAAIVAGGVGVAPVFMLAEELRKAHVRTLVLVGAMSEHDVPLRTADSTVALSFLASRPEVRITARDFEALGCEVAVVTMKGDKGLPGLPTEALDGLLHFGEAGALGEMGIFTCGPWAMMRQVARDAAEHGVRCQALLEERMGCGVGVCMACSIRVRGEGGEVRKRVCIDGPVFEASEVIWDEQ